MSRRDGEEAYLSIVHHDFCEIGGWNVSDVSADVVIRRHSDRSADES